MSNTRGNIKGAIWASAIVAAIIAVLPLAIVMTYEGYPKYCKMSILVPCVGVSND